MGTIFVMGEWKQALDAWETYLTAASTSPGTRNLRLYHLHRFASEVRRSPATVTFEHMTTWLAAQDWSPSTRRSYRASLRAFYSWALTVRLVDQSPAHLLPPVAVPRGRPRPTPEEVYRGALMRADDRTRLAILLGAQCGLRRGEIARARREDVEPDLLGHVLRVVGKGGNVRLVPLPDALATEILSRPAGWLFPSSHGGHLTPHHLGKLVTRALREGHTTHSLRHRRATVALAQTKDLRAVQELLGHAKPETTALYTYVPDTAVRAAMDAAAS